MNRTLVLQISILQDWGGDTCYVNEYLQIDQNGKAINGI